MDVSIIIVNYNTQDLTLQCLRSIYEKTTGLLFEVIVVDNDSSDDSVERIREEFPQIRLIESAENLGFGRANNLGFEYSSGHYIFLLNSDTVLINNAVEILWRFLNEHSNIAIVGGQLFEEDGLKTTHSYSCIFPSILWEFDILLDGRINHQIENKRLKRIARDGFITVAYITGADMMLRRDDIEQYGFFDPSFFMYYEESELSYRYHRNGRISAFIPTAKIIHFGGGSFSSDRPRSKVFLDGRRNYYKITHTIFYHKIADLVLLIARIYRAILNLRKRSKRRQWIERARLLVSKNK